MDGKKVNKVKKNKFRNGLFPKSALARLPFLDVRKHRLLHANIDNLM